MNEAELSDGEIKLELDKEVPADPSKNWLKAYHYKIILVSSGKHIGKIDFRVGYTTSVVFYGGHIGYEVFPEWRGNHYAGKACNILKNLAQKEGMDVFWITCNPDNIASKKTCEWLKATFVGIVDVPEDHDEYQKGIRQKCRYRVTVY